MIIKVNSDSLAMLLAQRKVEKKWKSIGFSPYIDNYVEYIGQKYTPEAEKDYDKHYAYFLEVILSKRLVEANNLK